MARHHPLDKVFAEVVAARERKLKLVEETIKNLGHSIATKQAQIAVHQQKIAQLQQEAAALRAEVIHVCATVPRPRCPEPCGKLRYTSSKAAMRANVNNDKTIRTYYDTQCHSWHVAKAD